MNAGSNALLLVVTLVVTPRYHQHTFWRNKCLHSAGNFKQPYICIYVYNNCCDTNGSGVGSDPRYHEHTLWRNTWLHITLRPSHFAYNYFVMATTTQFLVKLTYMSESISNHMYILIYSYIYIYVQATLHSPRALRASAPHHASTACQRYAARMCIRVGTHVSRLLSAAWQQGNDKREYAIASNAKHGSSAGNARGHQRSAGMRCRSHH